jgi:hypothetical protein
LVSLQAAWNWRSMSKLYRLHNVASQASWRWVYKKYRKRIVEKRLPIFIGSTWRPRRQSWNMSEIIGNRITKQNLQVKMRRSPYLRGYTRYRLFCVKYFRYMAAYVKKFAQLYITENVSVKIIGLRNENVTAEMLARYLRIKLEQTFGVGELLGNIKKGSNVASGLLGFRVEFRGRYSKRQRSSFATMHRGRIPLSTLRTQIEYAYEQAVLKYGTCGIKVWLYKRGGRFSNNAARYVSMVHL